MQGIIKLMPENESSLVKSGFLIEVEVKYSDDLDRLEFVIVLDDQADFQVLNHDNP